jgi:hypothetical protein
MAKEKGGLQVCKNSSPLAVEYSIGYCVRWFHHPGGLLRGSPSPTGKCLLVPALSVALVRLLRGLLDLLVRVGVAVGIRRPRLRRHGVRGRGRRSVSTPVRLLVHVLRHSVRWLGAVCNGAADDWHCPVPARRVHTASVTTASLRTSVRSFVDTDLSTVEVDVVHCLNGFDGVFLIGVAHKAKSSATTSVAVFDDDLARG